MIAAARARARRRRGVALVDFIAGTIILAGATTAWVSLTRVQLDAISAADRRLRARSVATRALEEARASGTAPLANLEGPADAQGFRLVRTFSVPGLPSSSVGPLGRLEARPLRVEPASDPGARPVWEVRAIVRWRGVTDVSELDLATVVGSSTP